MAIDYKLVLETAKEAAYAAGKYLRESMGKDNQLEYKGNIDLVTRHDKRSQEIIYDIVQARFPSHSMVGEEELDEQKDATFQWFIDPIDGTTNFSRSLPAFCVSIGLMVDGKPEVGVVYIPLLDELYHAVRGRGAFLNGSAIHVTKETDIGKSLLATGFPYDRWTSKNNNVNHFRKFILRCLGIRRMGAAAIDLCYVAAGRFDGFWELKLKPWDTAAAFLIVQEAGGIVTDFAGNPYNPFLKECLAANPYIHPVMVDILQQELT